MPPAARRLPNYAHHMPPASRLAVPGVCSVPNGPGGPVSGQNWPGPRVTGQADERPISTGFTLVETMGDWANHGS